MRSFMNVSDRREVVDGILTDDSRVPLARAWTGQLQEAVFAPPARQWPGVVAAPWRWPARLIFRP